jgi:hypothetical protein
MCFPTGTWRVASNLAQGKQPRGYPGKPPVAGAGGYPRLPNVHLRASLLPNQAELWAGPIANGQVGWTTGRFLSANRIVGASVGIGDLSHLVNVGDHILPISYLIVSVSIVPRNGGRVSRSQNAPRNSRGVPENGCSEPLLACR